MNILSEFSLEEKYKIHSQLIYYKPPTHVSENWLKSTETKTHPKPLNNGTIIFPNGSMWTVLIRMYNCITQIRIHVPDLD